MPAPPPPKLSRCSSTVDLRPILARAKARARPAMPPPAIRTGSDIDERRGAASGRAGPGVGVHQAPHGLGRIGREAGGVDVEGRAVGAQDLAVGPHVEIDVRMIEGWPRTHALELLDADRDVFDARVVGEMR